MCELFAVSSSFPACVNVCLQEFQQHGGFHNKVTDGWGMAFFEGNDARIIREAEAAYQSQHMDFIRSHNYASSYMLSHIRQATVGETRLQNTQPFSRELGGDLHVFAHNGDLENMNGHLGPDPEFMPIGTSDSESAFCDLMDRLKKGRQARGRALEYEERLEVIRDYASRIKDKGIFNFLYCDGEYLFVHSHKRTQTDGEIKPPGLYVLTRQGHHDSHRDIPGVRLQCEHDLPDMTLVASMPLTDENWEPLPTETITVLHQGRVKGSYPC